LVRSRLDLPCQRFFAPFLPISLEFIR
jgi:hypothetical protein